jgi:hypothetical protein
MHKQANILVEGLDFVLDHVFQDEGKEYLVYTAAERFPKTWAVNEFLSKTAEEAFNMASVSIIEEFMDENEVMLDVWYIAESLAEMRKDVKYFLKNIRDD